MYLLFSFSRFAVTFHHQKCILFSPFGNLRSLFTTRSVSYFLLLAICGHFRKLGVIFFSPFSDLQSLWKPGSVSFFLFFAICGHLPALEMYLLFYFSRFTVTSWRRICICFSPFSDLQSLLDAKNVSAFLLFAICGHLPAPESDIQSLVSNKKTQQKTIFSPDAAGFLDSKKDSRISCLFWRRYFFLWGVAKTI